MLFKAAQQPHCPFPPSALTEATVSLPLQQQPRMGTRTQLCLPEIVRLAITSPVYPHSWLQSPTGSEQTVSFTQRVLVGWWTKYSSSPIPTSGVHSMGCCALITQCLHPLFPALNPMQQEAKNIQVPLSIMSPSRSLCSHHGMCLMEVGPGSVPKMLHHNAALNNYS